MRECEPKDFCEDPNLKSFKPDTSHKDYYENIFNKFDLHCAPTYKIQLIGAVYFLGWIITLTFVPRLSDTYGRKKIFLIGIFFTIPAYVTLYTTENYNILIASIFCLGLAATIRA